MIKRLHDSKNNQNFLRSIPTLWSSTRRARSAWSC